MCRKTHPSPAWKGWKAWEIFTLVIRGTCGAFLGAALASYTDKETLFPNGFQLKNPKS
jgi:hypothetical protein